jgi:hypothetical protein
MKRVVQEDEYGCAASCLAIVVGISYSEARKYLVPQYTNADQLRGALRSHGVMLGKRISLGGKTYCDLPKKDGLFFANMITARGPTNGITGWYGMLSRNQSLTHTRGLFHGVGLGFLPFSQLAEIVRADNAAATIGWPTTGTSHSPVPSRSTGCGGKLSVERCP